ncbi:urotensin-2 receptor-like [Clytia hemisphaerica]|uniref:urotensin-2 receptor-like n=1 Tax=Clytia hemisphaerica TaxID=252671 RepID=UPI0034D6D951
MTTNSSVQVNHEERNTIFLSTKILPAVLCFGTIGNFLIIIYFIKINRKKLAKMSAYHFLIINLAIADFLTCLGMVFVTFYLGVPEWKLGKFGCSFMLGFSGSACPYASCWILVLLSYARYRSIVKPLIPRITKIKCSIICLIIWTLCLVGSLDSFLKRDITVKHGHKKCTSEVGLTRRILFSSIRFTLDSAIPVMFLLYFYIRIKTTMSREDRSNSLAANDSTRQRNQNALKTIMSLVIIYVICVCPGRLLYLTREVLLATLDENSDVYKGIQNTSGWNSILRLILLYLNNVVNIFVYLKLIMGFRNFLFTFGRWRRSEATLNESVSRT